MKRNNYERVIAFMNNPQVILYECELKGQISDGHWENARPMDHWKIMTDAKAIEDPSNLGPNFYPKRKYNFAAKDLVEVVDDRMIWWVKFYSMFPDIPLNEHWTYDLSDGSDDIHFILSGAREGEKHWIDKLKKIKAGTGYSDLFDLYKDVTARVSYTKNNLLRDLKQMSSIVNTMTRK